MEFSYTSYSLEYKYAFGVSSNTRKQTPCVFTKLTWEGFNGFGEACLPPYLGETSAETIGFFEKARKILKEAVYPCSVKELIMQIDELDKGCNAAKAAIDIALHDLKGKIEGKSVTELFGIQPREKVITACTIGIDSEDIIKQKIDEASEFKVLKIKAGTNNDRQLIQTIRKYSDKPLYVDVNQGWKDKYEALDLIGWLKEQKIELIEQPFPVSQTKETAWLTERSPLPIIADESCKRLADLQKVQGVFHGINLKLMKCTGIKEAFEMIERCKQMNLKLFIGCMAESSCAASAMAQFATCADFVDLDAPHLLKNDPFKGITYENGYVRLPQGSGIGAIPKKDQLVFQ
jgi:L-alanine-DL-glutamate epimerase-like enolase superfamily enzyme